MVSQYTDSIKGNDAVMLLYGRIGKGEKEESYINGNDFASEMYALAAQGKNIIVKINSPGGSVFDGYSIIDAIINTDATTHIVGMAASIAGVISQFGKRRLINDFAVGMVHAPTGKNEGLVGLIKTQLQNILKNNSKLSESALNDLMDGKSDNWFDSSQMLEKGLVDEIILTGKKVSKVLPEKAINYYDVYEIYNQIIGTTTDKTKKNNMEIENVAKAVKSEKSDEASVYARINELVNVEAKVESLTEQVKLLTTANAEMSNKIKEANAKAALELVENAINAKKIKAESKESWIKAASENYENTKNMLESFSAPFVSVTNFTSDVKGDVVPDYENMAKNEPEKLAEIMEKNPELYNKMEKAYHIKQKEKK